MKRMLCSLLAAVAILATLGLTTGCNDESANASNRPYPYADRPGPVEHSRVAEGTSLRVQLNEGLTTETARVGDPWSGTLAENVTYNGDHVIPAGSEVHGMVSHVVPAERGSRAVLNLRVRSVEIHGRAQSVSAIMPEIVAGSPRARNLGAIAGGAAAGALLGKVVGNGDHATAGAVIGGAAAGAAVAKSKGYQVVLKPGTVLDFTVSEAVVMR